MYVCICKGLNDADIDAAIKSGAKRVSEVFKHHGCKAQCGTCAESIKDAIGCDNDAKPAPTRQAPLAFIAANP